MSVCGLPLGTKGKTVIFSLGNFCVYEHDEHTTPSQPLLEIIKLIRDNMSD